MELGSRLRAGGSWLPLPSTQTPDQLPMSTVPACSLRGASDDFLGDIRSILVFSSQAHGSQFLCSVELLLSLSVFQIPIELCDLVGLLYSHCFGDK